MTADLESDENPEISIYFSADIEDQVIHVILELASPDSLDDYRTEAVAVSMTCLPTCGAVDKCKVNSQYLKVPAYFKEHSLQSSR